MRCFIAVDPRSRRERMLAGAPEVPDEPEHVEACTGVRTGAGSVVGAAS